MDYKEHWNQAYEGKETEQLGWYEDISQPSLDLIKECNIEKHARIINIGAGTSTLTDSLMDDGFSNIIVTDISNSALEILRKRLSHYKNQPQFIHDDLTNPTKLQKIEPVDLWHDRAVLHFLTKEEERSTYFNLVKSITKIGSYVILAEFELEKGAEKCCNLNVYRYTSKMLGEYLGDDFELIKDFPYTFFNPRKDTRAYIYTLFKRKS